MLKQLVKCYGAKTITIICVAAIILSAIAFFA